MLEARMNKSSVTLSPGWHGYFVAFGLAAGLFWFGILVEKFAV